MQTTFLTCSRKPSYIKDSLSSLWKAYPEEHVELFVGSPDELYLDEIRKDERVTINSMPTTDFERCKPVHNQIKACINMKRLVTSRMNEDLLTFEDDIDVKHGIKEAIEKINEHIGESHPIGFYSLVKIDQQTGPGYYDYGHKPHSELWGLTIGLYVPARFRAPFADLLERAIPGKNPKEYTHYDASRNRMILCAIDCAARHLVEKTDARLIMSVPSYVNHVGKVSSVGNTNTRSSPMF